LKFEDGHKIIAQGVQGRNVGGGGVLLRIISSHIIICIGTLTERGREGRDDKIYIRVFQETVDDKLII